MMIYRSTVLALMLGYGATVADAQQIVVQQPDKAFGSVVKAANIDTAVYADWVAGKENKIQAKTPGAQLPQWVLWTDKSEPHYHGVSYGASATPGPRHLRIGFHTAIPIGSLLVDGGGRPSVLKAGAAYPGDLNDESQWVPAQRLIDGHLSDEEVKKAGEYALWVFPSGIQTRAIRFSHTSVPTDGNYAGTLIGALVMKERLNNIAPLAIPSARSNSEHANELVNGRSDNWNTWDNRGAREVITSETSVITADHPEWLLLTWPQPVKISGLCTLWSGFSTATVEAYTGPADKHPRDATDKEWQKIADYSGAIGIFGNLWPNRLDFGHTVTTRALRLKMTAAVKETGTLNPQGGRRIWMGELMALEPLADRSLQVMPVATKALAASSAQPPIAIPFTLQQAGYVTLVIEDKNGFRVKNLLADTWFGAGRNVAYWDGLDDLGRDIAASHHGVYHIPGRLVASGEYKVRGLVHGTFNTSYEFSVYAPGNPPWVTDDHVGGWLADHSPPMAALFVPAKQSPAGQPVVLLGCYVTESVDGFACVDLNGKKLIGRKWVGSTWTVAPYLARDAGSKAAPDVYAYAATVWESARQSGEGELRVTGITAKTDKQVIVYPLGPLMPKNDKAGEIGGFAINDGIGVVSLVKKNQLLLIEMTSGKVMAKVPVPSPHGLAFDKDGRLLVLSGGKLLRWSSFHATGQLPAPQTIVSDILEAPVGITLDAQGKIYVSDGGESHQVKIFTADGKYIRAIGTSGAPSAGAYDPLHMNNPAGITIDSRQQLWVTENDFLPKRVSVWSLDGKLIRAFYGPSKYGGGGTLDPNDKNWFYYAEEARGAMAFALDWKTGQSRLDRVYYREVPGSPALATRSAAPETPLYYKGQRYFTNCYNSSPTSGHAVAFLFTERNGIAYPVAAMGRADSWEVLKQDAFKKSWPAGVDLRAKAPVSLAFFIWSDTNEDAQVQPGEVVFEKGLAGGVTVMDDLSFSLSVRGNAMQYMPVGFTPHGIPLYRPDNGRLLAEGAPASFAGGGNQILTAPDGWTVVTEGLKPFENYSISGAKGGKLLWNYPDVWPNLPASHEAPLPAFPGQLIGPTRLLGGWMRTKDAGPVWAINSNHGMVYLFTSDGMFITTLFEPMRAGKAWHMPVAERGMSMKGVTLSEENFWPTITQTKEGEVYLVNGRSNSLVKIDGLNTVQRLPVVTITVTNADLAKSRSYQVQAEAQRQQTAGRGLLQVAMRTKPITVDGKLDDWMNAAWVEVDKTGVYANFNAHTKPYDVTGALAVSNDRLYAAYRTGDAGLLQNTGEVSLAPFKTGGALDLMIGTDPAARQDRQAPVAGDIRLLVTTIQGKPRAWIYRAVVPGANAAAKVPFSSPWHTVTFDQVEEVTSQLTFAADKTGNYEFSIPLSLLHLQPEAGMVIKGDIGLLRGDGAQTIARVYWSNKGAGLVSDVPSEAELMPMLWGNWEFKSDK